MNGILERTFSLALVLILIFIGCNNTPAGSNDDKTDENDSEELEVTVFPVYIKQNQEYKPYQKVFGLGDMSKLTVLDVENGEYPLIIGEDTTEVLIEDKDNYRVSNFGIEVPEEFSTREVLSFYVPVLNPGTYTFQVPINDEYIYEGEIQVGSYSVISDPNQRVNSKLSQLDDLFNDFRPSLDTTNAGQQDLIRLDSLKGELDVQLAQASDEELEELAYIIQNNSEFFESQFFKSKINTEACLAETPEEALKLIFRDIKNKLTFSSLLQVFSDSKDQNDPQVPEPSLIDTFLNWTNMGKALDLITSIKENFKCLWMVVDESITTDLEAIGNNKRRKLDPEIYSKSKDTLQIETGVQYRLSFYADYANTSPELINGGELGDNELWEPFREISSIIQNSTSLVSGLFYPEPDTTNFKVDIKYFKNNLADFFNPSWDLQYQFDNNGNLILEVTNDTIDVDYTGIINFLYSPADEYQDILEFEQSYRLTGSSCPDPETFIPGKWELIFYWGTTTENIYQINRDLFDKNGTYETIEKRSTTDEDFVKPTEPIFGTWSTSCNDGEFKISRADDFFGASYTLTYDNELEFFVGSWARANNRLELKRANF
ncbi:MAG: hypothetical protein ROO71_00540 [Balneola sp.]